MLKESIPTNRATWTDEKTSSCSRKLSFTTNLLKKLHQHVGISMPGVTYNKRSHAVFKDKWGIDLLKKKEEEAVLLYFLSFLELHTAHNV